VLNWLFNNIGNESSRRLLFLFRHSRELICRRIPSVPDISLCSLYYMLLQSRFVVPRVELIQLLEDRHRGFNGSCNVMMRRFAPSYVRVLIIIIIVIILILIIESISIIIILIIIILLIPIIILIIKIIIIMNVIIIILIIKIIIIMNVIIIILII
jgi:hypothetical protein